MKTKRFITAVLAAFAVLAGGCGSFTDEKEQQTTQQENVRESVQESVQEALQSAQEDESQKTAGETEKVQETQEKVTPAGTVMAEEVNGSQNVVRLANDKKILLTGDSRTVCLYCSQIYDETEYPKHIFYGIDANTFTGYTNESIVVAKGGEGCSWMKAIGMPIAVSHLDEADAIVIWFGINDLAVFADYINYVNGLVSQYDIPIYYMTVGPCNGKWAEKNGDVIAFNAALAQFLDPSVTVIDTYSYIQSGLDSGAFATMDGLHYDYKTSRAIYQYMLEQVGKTE